MTSGDKEATVAHVPGPRRRNFGSPVRIAVQVALFAVGLGLFAWAIGLALRPDNRELLSEKLQEAGPGGIAMLVGLSVVTIILNGLLFLVTIRPVMKLRASDMVAVNACATLLSMLPFKLSLLFRTVVHNRRDGVPLFTIGSWFGVMSLLLFAFFGPITGISSWRRDIDLLWIVLTPGAVLGLFVLIWWLAGRFSGDVGLARFIRWIDFLRIKGLSRFVRSDTYAKMHAGVVMLADWRALLWVLVIRIADMVTLTARFWIAAEILDVQLGLEGSVLLACIYFLTGAISPAGQLGSREAAVIASATVLAMTDPERLAPVALLITGTELLAMIATAGIGIIWLNPLKLFTARDAGLLGAAVAGEDVAQAVRTQTPPLPASGEGDGENAGENGDPPETIADGEEGDSDAIRSRDADRAGADEPDHRSD